MRREAMWFPGWYELDPILEVGAEDEYYFWRSVPKHLPATTLLVLYNTIFRPEDALVAHGVIGSIHHPDLGAISKIDTRGLDYTITLVDGTELLVNAEENPGELLERSADSWEPSPRSVSSWGFTIEFLTLTEPRAA